MIGSSNTCLHNIIQIQSETHFSELGLSEPTAEQIELTDQVFHSTARNPFAFVQSACSIASQRAFKNRVYSICMEKGIQFVSYTSTVRGLVDERLLNALSEKQVREMNQKEIISAVQAALQIPTEDFRMFVGFFDPSVIKNNIICILQFQMLARSWNKSPSQLALAWQKAHRLLPIPGTSKIEHLRSNIEAMSIDLTEDQVHQINTCFESFSGNPNPPKMLDNDALEV